MSKAGSLSVFYRRMPGFIESETLPCLVSSNFKCHLEPLEVLLVIWKAVL